MILPVLLAVLAQSPLAEVAEATDRMARPRVFRSALDGRPRMLVAELDRELWLAWNAETCALSRAWRGEVLRDGVAEPASFGGTYLELEKPPRWELVVGGDERRGRAAPHYSGYRLEGDTLEILFELRFPGDVTVRASVEPSAVHGDGRVSLRRLYRLRGLRPGFEVTVVGLDGTDEPRTVSDAGRLVVTTSHELSRLPGPTGTAHEAPEKAPPGEPRSAGDEPEDGTLDDGHEEHGPRERGVSLHVYDVDVPLDRVPLLIEGQRPNVNVVVPRVELFGADAFGGVEDTFVAVLEGFLETGSGTHTFRLSSDDGSILALDGEVLIDNDGLHGHSGEVAAIDLAAGLHELEIVHFENLGAQSLELAWRRPGTYEFEVVPDRFLSCRAGVDRATSPGAKAVDLGPGDGLPGDGAPLEDLHPSLDLERVRPSWFEPRVGGMDWLSDGRLVLCTTDPAGSVYVLDGVAGDDPDAIEVERIAWGLADPLGLSVVDDRVFVLQRQELTELVDRDGDGSIDTYRAVASGWETGAPGRSAVGLVHTDGSFHVGLADGPGSEGVVVRIDTRTGEQEVVARGLRSPDGVGLGVGGAVFVADGSGDPSWAKLVRLEEGAFYGRPADPGEAGGELVVTPPVAWLPRGAIGESPSQPTVLPPGFGPYSGHVVLGDLIQGGLTRVFVEEPAGVLQGAAFRFTQGLESGVRRLCVGPDGALHVGGAGSSFGLERLTYNGNTAFEMLAVRAFANGFEVELTEPLAEGDGWDPLLWDVTRRIPSSGEDPERLLVRSSTPDEERRRVFVEIPGLEAGGVVHLRLAHPLVSTTGRRPWTAEAWYTLNRVPRPLGPAPERPDELNTLTEQEREEGWQLLFDGESLDAFRGFRREDAGKGWAAVDGTLSRVGPGGDLVTREVFGDFELSLEVRVSRGGDSGVHFRVTEDYGAAWQSGPELQVRGTAGSEDATGLASTGANYGLHAPMRDASRPVGQWNEVLIRVWDDHVEHWLNGVKVVDYRLWDAEWERLVAESRFADMPAYGRVEEGHIALQDGGQPVAFRNLEIRRL